MILVAALLAMLAAYLVGSLSFAVLISRVKGANVEPLVRGRVA